MVAFYKIHHMYARGIARKLSFKLGGYAMLYLCTWVSAVWRRCAWVGETEKVLDGIETMLALMI